MGIFTRFRDIVSSNINAMLDRAEDPEKLIKLMIREMEDTLIELKSGCAGVMAERKTVERRMAEVNGRVRFWEERASLAVDKGRDDLAREALMEKRRFAEMIDGLDRQLRDHDVIIDQYRDDIRQLEEKLAGAREKQRLLVQRHVRARRSLRAQEEIRRADGTETIARFDKLENRIELMEAEADLVNFGHRPPLEEAFDKLATEDDIEKELASLKTKRSKTAAAGKAEPS